MTTYQSLVLGIKSSAGYFISTLLFGVMFGIAASSVDLDHGYAMLMSASVFSASAQFASLEFWIRPLPFATIALSVALVSSRNILLGMSMAHHFDEHNLFRRVTWLFLLNDPGVVTSFKLEEQVDRLGYVAGYGISLMISWLISTALGLAVSDLFEQADLGSLSFAGPLVMATMMILFVKGSGATSMPWIVSGVAALILFELDTPAYLILILSVIAGVLVPIINRKKYE